MRKLLGLSSLAAFIGTAACTSPLVAPEQYSGFLQDYEQRSPWGAKVARRVDPDLQIARYTNLFLEPSQFLPQPQPNAHLLQETRQGITDYFDSALRRELSKVMPLTDSPSIGTWRNLGNRRDLDITTAHVDGLQAQLNIAQLSTAWSGRRRAVT